MNITNVVEATRNRYQTLMIVAGMLIGAMISAGLISLSNLRQFEHLGEAPIWAIAYLALAAIVMLITLFYASKVERADRFEKEMAKLTSGLESLDIGANNEDGGKTIHSKQYSHLKDQSFQVAGHSNDKFVVLFADWQRTYLFTGEGGRKTMTYAEVHTAYMKLLSFCR